MKEFEYAGMWWLPQFPAKKIAGILKFHPTKGADLQLIGSTFSSEIFKLFGVASPNDPNTQYLPSNPIVVDIIQGQTSENREVSLYQCATYFAGADFRIGHVFVGHLFEKKEDVVFDSITISYSNLEKWLGLSGFSGTYGLPPEPRSLKMDLKYETPLAIETKVGEFKITFYTWPDGFPMAIEHKFSMSETAFIKIEPNRPLHYDEFHRTAIYYLRNFINLGINMPTVPKIVFGEISSISKNLGVNNQEIADVYKSNTVGICYVAKGATLRNEEDHIKDKLFLRKDIDHDFEQGLNHWFAKSEQLLGIQDLYFGLFYVPPIYLELEFLTLAQAIEGYHRIMHDGTFMTKAAYKVVRKTLEKAIPLTLDAEHIKSLKSRIQYGNEFTLRMRIREILTEILKEYERVLKRKIGDYEEFIDEFVGFRNRLTHPTKHSKRLTELEIQQLRELIRKSHRIMQLCFLAEMEFSAVTVEKIMTQ